MMIHRHQEGDFPNGNQHMTKLDEVTPFSKSTDPNDPLYVAVADDITEPTKDPLYVPTDEEATDEEPTKRGPGRPRKN